MTFPSEKIGEPLSKETKDPLLRTKVGEPTLSSNTELVNTLPLSEPGEFMALEVLTTDENSVSSLISISSGKSIIPNKGTNRKRIQILIARLF